MSTRGNRPAVAATISVVVVVVAVALVALLRHEFRSRHAGSAAGAEVAASATSANVPSSALTTLRKLVTGASAAAQRAAMTPELAAVLPAGRPFPAGTVFTPDAGSWVRSGPYAHLTGTLRVPGAPPSRVEVGLMRRVGHWRVTFEEKL